jgi:RING finger protein 113A
VDYNPERCKDWYETGRCNFGDSCVFIHDRSDYKSGWQLDQEFEEEQKRKQLRLMGHDVEDGEENYEIHSQEEGGEDAVVCRICESLFTDPVGTQCGHYFCERCALQHYSSSAKCFTCEKPTNGIFNDAPQKIKAKVAAQLIKK